jgi:hypothetical protein
MHYVELEDPAENSLAFSRPLTITFGTQGNDHKWLRVQINIFTKEANVSTGC